MIAAKKKDLVMPCVHFLPAELRISLIYVVTGNAQPVDGDDPALR